MEENRKELKILDLKKMSRMVWTNRKLVGRNLIVAFILSCIWIFPEPRYYTAEVSVAPETASDNMGGGLSAIAATFGMNLGGAQNDAIYPVLYPELFQSNEFIVSLFDIEVETDEGDVKCDYYTYMRQHQKRNYLTWPFKYAMRQVVKFLKPKKPQRVGSPEGDSKINSFLMSEEDFALVETIKSNITCAVDKKTDVATIIVKDQDRLVSATMANAVKEQLQEFIIKYRTSKARMDMEHYETLTKKAKEEYEAAVVKYSTYSDSHMNSVMQSYISERNKLENEMSFKFNTYNAMNSQLQSTAAKLQERIPAFTTLKSATVPIKPAGPKRMVFIIGMMLLTFIGTSMWVCRSELFKRNKD